MIADINMGRKYLYALSSRSESTVIQINLSTGYQQQSLKFTESRISALCYESEHLWLLDEHLTVYKVKEEPTLHITVRVKLHNLLSFKDTAAIADPGAITGFRITKQGNFWIIFKTFIAL